MRCIGCVCAVLTALVVGFALVTASAAPGALVVPAKSAAPATSTVPTSVAPPAAALIPAAGDGLVRQGDPSVYAGDQLYDFIDGGAPQYMEYGFAEAVSQELTFHGRTYIYDVYRMADPLAAYGIWSVRRPQRCTPLGTLPFSCVTLPQAMLAHGPYYIEIAAYEKVTETVAEMVELVRRGAAGMDSTLASTDLLGDAPFSSLPALDRVAGSEKLARGPVSLRTGLGREASGPLGPVLEALLASAPAAQTWVMASYHARPADDPASAATTLVVLVGGARTDALWRAARGALPAEAKVALPNPRAWITMDEVAGQSLFGVMSGSDLVLGASRLPADALETWITQPTVKSVQP